MPQLELFLGNSSLGSVFCTLGMVLMGEAPWGRGLKQLSR